MLWESTKEEFWAPWCLLVMILWERTKWSPPFTRQATSASAMVSHCISFPHDCVSFHTSSDICKCNGFPLHWFPTRLRRLSHVKRHLQVQWFPTPLVSHTVASPFTRQATSASALVSHCVELSHTAAFLILTSTSLLQCYLCIKYITLIITCS
jgi:hypothetical protein